MSSMASVDAQQCEIFTVVWLDAGADVDEKTHTEQKLRSVINHLKKFQEVEPCQEYIEQCSSKDRLVIIASGRLGQKLVHSIHKLRHVVSIYIYCMDVKGHKQWADKYSKVHGVLDDLNDLVDRITKNHDVQKKVDEPLPIDIFTTANDPGQSTMGIFGQFVFFQVLIDCIIRLKRSAADRAEMIGCCKIEYEGNRSELENVLQFQQQYAADKALLWYTKNTFFYKTMNAALRKQNIHMIFLMHEYIADIQQLLKKHQSDKPLTVYRGQLMTSAELERLKSSIGKLISINSFFSTSLDPESASRFLKSSGNLESILFKIEANPKIVAVKPFADIRRHSEFAHEGEVLFMIGSIFRLDHIQQTENKIWMIKMTLSSDEEINLKQVLMFMKGQIGTGETNLRTLGKVLWKMGQFSLAEQYFLRQLKELKSDDPASGELYEDLGELAALKGDYDKSVQWHQKALQFKTDGKNVNSMKDLEVPSEAPAQPTPPGTEASKAKSGEIDVEQFKSWIEGYLKKHMEDFKQQIPKTLRDLKSVENFCYVLENKIPITNKEQEILRGLINLGFTFNDVNSEESLQLFRRIKNERIILILSKASMENLAKAIREEPFMSAIYVIDSAEGNTFDSVMYRKSLRNMAQLCTQLEKDLPALAYDLTTISSIPSNYTAKSTLSYVQVVKDIILDSNKQRDVKKEMIDFCRQRYAENAVQLRLIDEFEKNFQAEQALQWYTRQETFIYKMLTRAFRILDVDIIYKLRYFIQHLHHQIESSSDKQALTVYRTIRIRKDLIKKMTSYPQGLLSFNEFLFVTRNQSTIEPCLANTETRLVHFCINLAADTPRLAISTNQNRLLLSFGTIFRIEKIQAVDEKTFTVTLTTNGDVLKIGHQVSKDFRDAMRGSFPLLRMAKLVKYMEFTDYMEYFAAELMNDSQAVNDEGATLVLGGVLHALGGQCYERKQYDQGLIHLQNALKVYRRHLAADDTRLTPTYNNIGSIYHKQGLNEKALEYHEKAYQMQKNSPDPNMESVAAYAGNIASVLIRLDRHKDAIPYYEMDLKINRKLRQGKDNGTIAAKYFNLAGTQYRAQLYADALVNYEKCLEIELKCHSADNPTVGVTYYNMGTALEKLGRLKEAKASVEKGIERMLLTKKEEDEEVKMYRRYLQKIEEKLWMKDILV